MIREEAIHILNNLKPTNTKSSFDAYVVGEAITMAIKALEQEFNLDIRLNRVKNELNQDKNELEPTTKNDSPKYCDRSICLKNEYNNVGCEDCEVTKSQEPTTTNDIEVDYTINGLDDFIEFGKKAFGVELAIKKSDNPDTYEKLFETTKNDLGVDAISRADARSLICKIDIKHRMLGMSRKAFKDLYNGMDELPSITPQEPR